MTDAEPTAKRPKVVHAEIMFKALYFEIIDNITNQMKNRFRDLGTDKVCFIG